MRTTIGLTLLILITVPWSVENISKIMKNKIKNNIESQQAMRDSLELEEKRMKKLRQIREETIEYSELRDVIAPRLNLSHQPAKQCKTTQEDFVNNQCEGLGSEWVDIS